MYTCFSYNAIVPVIASTILSENIINLLRAVFIALAADVGISDSILSQQDLGRVLVHTSEAS